jgi:hypothetical protein
MERKIDRRVNRQAKLQRDGGRDVSTKLSNISSEIYCFAFCWIIEKLGFLSTFLFILTLEGLSAKAFYYSN